MSTITKNTLTDGVSYDFGNKYSLIVKVGEYILFDHQNKTEYDLTKKEVDNLINKIK